MVNNCFIQSYKVPFIGVINVSKSGYDLHNIAMNITFRRQCTNILLFGITRLRLSREQIKNRLYMVILGHLIQFYGHHFLVVRFLFIRSSRLGPMALPQLINIICFLIGARTAQFDILKSTFVRAVERRPEVVQS